ncbi:esterase/lipase family protein [Ramlibacter alkalitolerans]|uniref:Alpha/beta fold hydrolase n=1 Tax=Ramlibacter alkalitolerans TaxID=2039631 RepID=A0ABS1JKK3_9BURK|nr:alpha/beta fold hydrolase [Ramlibacter alkalitolerans]MBL0424320.1 alpha/beta fold hydrolase [Ramlibacter alkalitolerans]
MPSSLSFRAPSLALLVTEPLRALLETCAAGLGQPDAVQGDGHPVIVYPGLGAGSMTTAQLRGHLKACGFAVYDWELGVNRGPEGHFDDWLGVLVERVRAVHARHGRKVSLVGWSLGGVYARELAKLCPECVRQVVTLATPHKAIHDANHAGTLYRMLGGDTSQLTPELLDRLGRRPPVPVTSIYSESDGLVCWQGCLEEPAPDAENVAVDASHLGMPSHPQVLRIVADRLAQREGRWRPYARQRRTLRPRSTAPSRSRK